MADDIEIRLNESVPYSENRGDMQPDDPCYRVAFWQGRVMKNAKGKKVLVLLPFDAEGYLVADDGKTAPWAAKDQDGKAITHYPLWDDDKRKLVELLKQESVARKEDEGEEKDDFDMDWVSGRVNFLGFLVGQNKYEWPVLQQAAKKRFGKNFTSKRDMVKDLVEEHRIVSRDRLAPDLLRLMPAEA